MGVAGLARQAVAFSASISIPRPISASHAALKYPDAQYVLTAHTALSVMSVTFTPVLISANSAVLTIMAVLLATAGVTATCVTTQKASILTPQVIVCANRLFTVLIMEPVVQISVTKSIMDAYFVATLATA